MLLLLLLFPVNGGATAVAAVLVFITMHSSFQTSCDIRLQTCGKSHFILRLLSKFCYPVKSDHSLSADGVR